MSGYFPFNCNCTKKGKKCLRRSGSIMFECLHQKHIQDMKHVLAKLPPDYYQAEK